MSKKSVTIFWFRRDLRLLDNKGLFHAHQESDPVQPIFIFDKNILDKLEEKDDARVTFIHDELAKIQSQLVSSSSSLDVRYGEPLAIWKQLLKDYDVKAVWANKDYEPYARERDKAVFELLDEQGIAFKAKKDHVIFEKDEVLKKDGKPYTVYTPYSRVWKDLFTTSHINHYASEDQSNWHKNSAKDIISLEQMGFEKSTIPAPSNELNQKIIKNYHNTRNTPSEEGTTRMSVHLRFGTVSTRQLVKDSMDLNGKYLNELIWREFYQSILWHFPHVVEHNFNRKYDGVVWRNNEEEFEKWCQGKTGYPIVDAGMRELNTTGHMHNRVRMIVASFLTKHLLIDWRWGEAYFAKKLLDFELASNNGGWQWAAGTGVDAAPYFRIFNPYTQTDKFDPQLKYVKKWVPELETADYPKAIVEHKIARERALETYKAGLG